MTNNVHNKPPKTNLETVVQKTKAGQYRHHSPTTKGLARTYAREMKGTGVPFEVRQICGKYAAAGRGLGNHPAFTVLGTQNVLWTSYPDEDICEWDVLVERDGKQYVLPVWDGKPLWLELRPLGEKPEKTSGFETAAVEKLEVELEEASIIADMEVPPEDPIADYADSEAYRESLARGKNRQGLKLVREEVQIQKELQELSFGWTAIQWIGGEWTIFERDCPAIEDTGKPDPATRTFSTKAEAEAFVQSLRAQEVSEMKEEMNCVRCGLRTGELDGEQLDNGFVLCPFCVQVREEKYVQEKQRVRQVLLSWRKDFLDRRESEATLALLDHTAKEMIWDGYEAMMTDIVIIAIAVYHTDFKAPEKFFHSREWRMRVALFENGHILKDEIGKEELLERQELSFGWSAIRRIDGERGWLIFDKDGCSVLDDEEESGPNPPLRTFATKAEAEAFIQSLRA